MNQKKMGVFLSYAAEAIKILVTLWYTDFLVKCLGQTEAGTYQNLYTWVTFLCLLGLGFSASYVRFYSRYRVSNEKRKIAELNGMFISMFALIAVVAFLIGIAMAFNVNLLLSQKMEYSQLQLHTAKTFVILIAANVAINFPISIFDCIIVAHERFVFQRTLLLLTNILQPLITVPFLLKGCSYVAIAVVMVGLSVVKLIANWLYCVGKLKVEFVFGSFNREVFREIGVFTFFIFLNQIIDKVNWGMDKILLSKIKGDPGNVMINTYVYGATINTMFGQASTTISSVFVPEVNRIVAEDNDNSKLTDLMIKVGRIQFMVLSLILTGVFFFGKAFMKIWAKNCQAPDNAYYVAILLITPALVPLIQNVGLEIQRAKNMHKTRSLVYFAISLINVALSCFLIQKWDEIGAALGTCIAIIVGNVIFMNWYYARRIGLYMGRYWISIFKLLPALIIPAIAGLLINRYVAIGGWTGLIMWAVIYTIIYGISMLFFGMNKDEKALLKSII